MLQYDAAAGRWVNRALAEAGISAAGHTHDERYLTEAEAAGPRRRRWRRT